MKHAIGDCGWWLFLFLVRAQTNFRPAFGSWCRSFQKETRTLLEKGSLQKGCMKRWWNHSLRKGSLPLQNIVEFGLEGCNTVMGQHNSFFSCLRNDLPGITIHRCICHSTHLCAGEACKQLPHQSKALTRNIYWIFKTVENVRLNSVNVKISQPISLQNTEALQETMVALTEGQLSEKTVVFFHWPADWCQIACWRDFFYKLSSLSGCITSFWSGLCPNSQTPISISTVRAWWLHHWGAGCAKPTITSYWPSCNGTTFYTQP